LSFTNSFPSTILFLTAEALSTTNYFAPETVELTADAADYFTLYASSLV
jgi:hypothetical protein